MRLCSLESTTLRADQALLTGESEPVLKDPLVVVDEASEIQGRVNMLFSGTTISYGAGVGVVVQIGASTEIGKIGVQVASTQMAASPLKVKLDEFGSMLSKASLGNCPIRPLSFPP